MIDLHFWPTPNGHKITIFLEEAGVPYRIVPVNIGRGDQFKPEFLAISPNNRMPAIVDHDPKDGGEAIGIFESGAILQYLGEKTGRFFPTDVRAKKTVLEWLCWQIGGVGPMFGQLGHFKVYAAEQIPYAITRYTNEAKRLCRVLNQQLDKRDFVANEYSIADMALFPWLRVHQTYAIDMAEYPNVHAWLDRIAQRPAVARALELGEKVRAEAPQMDEEAKKILFNQR